MEQDRLRWDERYRAPGYLLGRTPAPFLVEQIDLITRLSPGHAALDIACGEGRNSIFLAHHGFDVTGLDISPEGLKKARRRMREEGVHIDFRRVDLERYRFTERYDLIVNVNFLLRDLIPAAVAALTPGGILLFESILDSPGLQGFHTESFLLQPGELSRLFAPCPGSILHLEERPGDPTPTARLIFRKALSPGD